MTVAETWTVELERRDDTGKWSAPCPICKLVVRAVLESSTLKAICDHMYQAHFRPVRGNA